MKHEGYTPEEIEAEVEAIEWSTTGLWNKVEEGHELVIEPAVAIDLDSPVERAAEALWNNQGPVIRGVRAKWDVARNEPEWAKSVQGYRAEARLALDAAARAGGKDADTTNDIPAK
ncbi:hypothetical protein [Arthrobacter sp. ES1]|uniref:hypothetical protein n=1 Tax=Arthrobacter sp. ES1 TaxID=1897056 RepID=UPI001CFF8BEE|nr:hypothetical protein [Arthrobacter sp. ES1]MCB5280385.1 hypothetical protein [Arthrobacter sp. ES1]